MLEREGLKMNHKKLFRLYQEEGLAVNDDCTRENLCLIADFSFSGERVARELSALIRVYGVCSSWGRNRTLRIFQAFFNDRAKVFGVPLR